MQRAPERRGPANHTFEDYVHDVENGVLFSSTKINHGFWERMLRMERAAAFGAAQPELDDPNSGGLPFVRELLGLLRRLPRIEGDFRFAASPFAWPRSRRVEGTPIEGLDETRRMIRRYVAPEVENFDGLLWKKAIIDGSFPRLIDALRNRSVVLVGPRQIGHFGAFAGIEKFRHIPIDERAARAQRRAIRTEIISGHEPGGQPVYLFQAGATAAWLVIRLHGELAGATMIDLGLALDICNPRLLAKRYWSRVFRTQVASTFDAINADWLRNPAAYSDAPPGRQAKAARAAQSAWTQYRLGILTDVAKQAALTPRTEVADDLDGSPSETGPLTFVEAKRVDWRRVEEILKSSALTNQWTNFGPVSLALEASLETLLRISPDRAIVMCSSATTALHALAGVHAVRAGRPLRWLISGFGFASTRAGALAANVQILDCDESGFLDLGAADEVPSEAWDGMIVTNVFGLAENLDRYRAFCRDRGKTLIIDNATAFAGFDRSGPDASDEIISFHHTKPWGVGEGGCAVVAREDAELLRRILSFGVGAPAVAFPFSGNGRISDYACALILERLERIPRWSLLYQLQQRRIRAAALRAGLAMLHPVTDMVHASVAALASQPISDAACEQSALPLRKYYAPLAPGLPLAQGLYARIVIVPSHPGMAHLSTDRIEEELRILAGRPAKHDDAAEARCPAVELQAELQ